VESFEKLGAFYLGKPFDPGKGAPREEYLLYDSRDLTTHAVCVGMTGSGKTGLCLSLLEEAALDGVPALAIDPKGDLGNLLLTFPELRPSDFRPWIDPNEAARQGMSPDDYAARTAETWRNGLAQWGQDGARIARLRSSADLAIYTPGSNAGLPLTLLRSFSAPPPALLSDADGFLERIASAASGLLALLGIEADPVRSREHILLSNLLQRAWQEGRDLDLASLIREIQAPPLERVGVMDLESFFPKQDRFALSLSLNNLLASPGFSAWMEGEPLDVARLLWTPQGKPRISILSIAHLSDQERMFFVTLLLNEVVAWMRTQPGTGSLRALLYMDEIFGYFPPTANPPSKVPMLTLLKQGRAFGLGVVLATQNPVDLDYKGLSNAGTWFLGRLQTERDKARVLEGLEGASAGAGAGFDRQKIEAMLAGLKSRVFLMNNAHEDQPVLFQTRWSLSYLRGPLTRAQIQILMGPRKEAAAAPPAVAGVAPGSAAPSPSAPPSAVVAARPVLAPGVPEFFLPRRGPVAEGARLEYRPALLGGARVHYTQSKAGVDRWETVSLLASLAEEPAEDLWDKATPLPEEEPELEKDPSPGAGFSPLPAAAVQAKSYEAWKKGLADALYRNQSLVLYQCPALEQVSRPGETEGDFRVRLAQAAREKRDQNVESLRKRYAPKAASLQDRIARAEQRTEIEKSQYDQQKIQTAISMGATILGAFFGRKLTSAGNVGRATTAMRGVGRAAREREDLGRALESAEELRGQLSALEAELQEEISGIQRSTDPMALSMEEIAIHPRKADISITRLALVWTPWKVNRDGTSGPVH
jgi:hypothetical protein